MSAPPDHNKNRETVNLDHCHQTGPVSGGTENVYQNTKCPKCGTQSACRVQTKPFFGNLGSLGGWTLGITNVQGGIPTPYTYTRTIQVMPAIWFVHSTFGVHCDTKGGEICDHTQGLKKPPVPRRLVGESQIPGLSPTSTGTSK